jgi:N-acetylmuramoyl-L-alanine amidase
MTGLLLGLLLIGQTSVGVRVIPRLDGLLLELSYPSAVELTDSSVTVAGYMLSINTGTEFELPDIDPPFWMVDWELRDDSLCLALLMDSSIVSVDWALSPDSLTLLCFLMAAEPVAFPEVSWQGPPDDEELVAAYYSDSLVYEALGSGRVSPWLEEFDCIVIDPGHGGRDPGAIGPTGSFEKDRTLEIALLVRDLMDLQMPGVRVVMTRESDEYVSLGARTRMANSERADLFLSIHCNASTRAAANGFETFFLSRARTDDARAVEMLENQAIEYDDVDLSFEADPLSFLLADIAQNVYLNTSSGLASGIQRSMDSHWPGRSDRGVKRAGFYVLRGAYMPSVLVEVAFISNPDEEQLLKSLDFRFNMAQAIVAAVEMFSTGQETLGW